MSTTSQFTAEQLLALPMGMGKRYELVAGELRVMSPGSWRHGNVIGNLQTLLGSFIRQNDLGIIFGAGTGFRLSRDPDTVRAPDIAFIAKQNLPAQMPEEAFWPGAPDLAVEVLSPDDRKREVREKIAAWLEAGTAAVWIVDPDSQTVTIHHPAGHEQVYSAGQSFTGEPVIRGFSCSVDELFR